MIAFSWFEICYETGACLLFFYRLSYLCFVCFGCFSLYSLFFYFVILYLVGSG